MASGERRDVWLDYEAAAELDLLTNLSAVASCGDVIWPASDEGRSVVCLEGEMSR